MKIISFGEILWDVFDGKKEIGGAPFNFAAHAARLGAESFMVSALGNDENGRDALCEVKRLGIKTDYIGTGSIFPTGACRVALINGTPTYKLLTDTAFDHIPRQCPKGSFDALYMGTLAMRAPESRKSFEALLRCTTYKEVFFDINIREGFHPNELMNFLLSATTILKFSTEEVAALGFGKDELRVCLDLSAKYRNLKLITVTLGKDGAFVFDCKTKQMLCSDKPKNAVVSTVGAGDSFSACFLYNYLNGAPLGDCLDRAVALSDFVVTSLGAVPEYNASEFR